MGLAGMGVGVRNRIGQDNGGMGITVEDREPPTID